MNYLMMPIEEYLEARRERANKYPAMRIIMEDEILRFAMENFWIAQYYRELFNFFQLNLNN